LGRVLGIIYVIKGKNIIFMRAKKRFKLLMPFYFAICIALFPLGIRAQKVTMSGYVKDKSNGEVLIGAYAQLKDKSIGAVTNVYGFYSLTTNPGNYILTVSYMGYGTLEVPVDLSKNAYLNCELEIATKTLKEVVVTAKKSNENVVSSQMSLTRLSAATIKQVPVIYGETDIMRTLQLLPGVKSTGEAGTGLSVRGGTRDQNMIILDEAPVYNANHLGGLFSVFNNDAIKSVELYKGNIPVSYGGRLSSLVDIRMKDGNFKQFAASGGIGTISSRLTLEMPIVKDKGSIMISGRRTYIDLLTKLVSKIYDTVQEIPYSFYDLNLKANYSIDENNRVYLSGYFGRDGFSSNNNNDMKTSFNWGNYTGTTRWNHTFNQQLFSNFTFLISDYDYKFGNEMKIGREQKILKFDFSAAIKDYSFKTDLGYYLNEKNIIRFGIGTIYHDFNTGEVDGRNDTVKFNFKMPIMKSVENSAYLGNEQKINDRLTLKYGLRFSLFSNIGSAIVNHLDENYYTIKQDTIAKNKFYNTYHGFEPRLGTNFVISENSSLKAGYSRTYQYLLVASNSVAGNPLDVWISVNKNIKPEIADLFSVGYFRNFLQNKIEGSVEVYYKNMQNQVDFKEFSQPLFNPRVDEALRFGKGRAYGIEFSLRKNEGKLTGWISYTLSRSERKIKDIQEKDWYLSPYDVPNDFSIVAMYELTKRLSISTVWVYQTGRPFNSPAARWEFGKLILPYYPGRNKDRYPNYHRLDLSVTVKSKIKPNKRWHGEWIFSAYNAYNQDNASSIYFETDKLNPLRTKAMQSTLFKIMPSVTYNFNF
jgi:hypothetical protein